MVRSPAAYFEAIGAQGGRGQLLVDACGSIEEASIAKGASWHALPKSVLGLELRFSTSILNELIVGPWLFLRTGVPPFCWIGKKCMITCQKVDM